MLPGQRLVQRARVQGARAVAGPEIQRGDVALKRIKPVVNLIKTAEELVPFSEDAINMGLLVWYVLLLLLCLCSLCSLCSLCL